MTKMCKDCAVSVYQGVECRSDRHLLQVIKHLGLILYYVTRVAMEIVRLNAGADLPFRSHTYRVTGLLFTAKNIWFGIYT